MRFLPAVLRGAAVGPLVNGWHGQLDDRRVAGKWLPASLHITCCAKVQRRDVIVGGPHSYDQGEIDASALSRTADTEHGLRLQAGAGPARQYRHRLPPAIRPDRMDPGR